MRCRFHWMSVDLGEVRCWHENGHQGRHEAWASRKARRREPGAPWTWVASNDFGYWLPK